MGVCVCVGDEIDLFSKERHRRADNTCMCVCVCVCECVCVCVWVYKLTQRLEFLRFSWPQLHPDR